MKTGIKGILLGGVWLALAVMPAVAAPLAPPRGPVVLTVSGAISNTNTPQKTAAFDANMLKALGMTKVKTSTTWTKGVPAFSGPLARAVLNAVGAKGEAVTAVALNDYKVEIPTEDFKRYDVILAMTMDNKAMTRRDKGPLWIIYPRDQHPELKTPEMDSRFLWQLKLLEVH